MSVPLIPTFLPISVVDDSDTKLMPLMNTFRGDIVPATFDSFGNINNHPTPFYILCTAKIYNTGNDIPSLPVKSAGYDVRTYQQFGLTQGNPSIFRATNAFNNNAATKNIFALTTFTDALQTQNQTDTSPGLLVPVYCYQDPSYNVEGINTPAFGFFRADVFWNGPLSINFQDYIDKIPDKPLNYTNFPTPFGVNINNVYNLCSVYTLTPSDNNRVGTWSIFATNQQINIARNSGSPWSDGFISIVSIAFNKPTAPVGIPTNTNILRTSTYYTVIKMNQYNNTTINWPSDFNNTTIKNWVPKGQDKPAPTINMGYPLNFVYQVGSTTGYKGSQGLYQNYYQNNIGNYAGTICQNGILPDFTNPSVNPPTTPNNYCLNSGWGIDLIAKFFQGSGTSANPDPYSLITANRGTNQNIDLTTYTCLCTGKVEGGFQSSQYNGACSSEGFRHFTNGIVENGNFTANAGYYYNTCNMVHAGIYQFTAFQFIPIDFFTPPPKGSIPSIVSPSNGATGGAGYTGPKLTEFYSEEGFPGSIGPTGVTGTTWPTQATGAVLPGPPIGPTGAGIYTITYPYNGATGASNPWPDNSAPNRMNNQFLTRTISQWIVAPDTFVCPTLISDQKYCGFQDYYHALMGYFYTERPQDLQPNSICGKAYIPPWTNMRLEGFYPNGGCTGTQVCVPNYQWLEEPDNIPGPFICQDSISTDPFPESSNGFNNTNTYTFLNYDGNPGLLGPQYPNGTPITWENMYNYLNLTPSNTISLNQVSFDKQVYTDTQKLATTQNVNPQTGKTQNQKGPGTVVLFLIIIVVIIIIGIIIFIFVKSGNSKKKDMYNPGNEMFYSRVV
jgi:hypothetical protein